jgi:hypothetical protein
VSRAIAFTLVALAVVTVAFVATWLTIPPGRFEEKNLTTGRNDRRVPYPARLFRIGFVQRGQRCASTNPDQCRGDATFEVRFVDLHALRSRVAVFYGGLAWAVALMGLALGLMFRHPSPARE